MTERRLVIRRLISHGLMSGLTDISQRMLKVPRVLPYRAVFGTLDLCICRK